MLRVARIKGVPTLGGAERKVRDTHWEEREFYEVFWYFGRLSWSPDGKLLSFSDRTSGNEPTSIFLLSLDSLARSADHRLGHSDPHHRQAWAGRVTLQTRCRMSGGLAAGVATRLGHRVLKNAVLA